MNKIFSTDMYSILKEKVQEKTLPLIELDALYITEHSNIRTQVTIPENIVIRSNVIIQTQQNGTDMSFKRAVIRYQKNYNLVLNIYYCKKSSMYFGKVLTALTDKQLHLSRNMNKGKIESAFNLSVKEVIHEDRFFPLTEYGDLLNSALN